MEKKIIFSTKTKPLIKTKRWFLWTIFINYFFIIKFVCLCNSRKLTEPISSTLLYYLRRQPKLKPCLSEPLNLCLKICN